MTVLKERVCELRPGYLPVDPVTCTAGQPGGLAQCELWFPPVDIPLGYGQSGRPPVLVRVSGYSRIISARMLLTRTTGDLIDGHWKLLSGWRAVPRMLVRDNAAGIGRATVTGDSAAFAGLLATRIRGSRKWLEQRRAGGRYRSGPPVRLGRQVSSSVSGRPPGPRPQSPFDPVHIPGGEVVRGCSRVVSPTPAQAAGS